MKQAIAALIIFLYTAAALAQSGRFQAQDGDIIFQTSLSSQSRAIQLATRSRYSHMGIIFYLRGRPYVLEAAATVRYTPLPLWINKGKDGHFVIKRLKGASLGSRSKSRLHRTARRFVKKPYDLYFGWSDRRIYCSELVWKIYQRSLGVEIGRLQQLRQFDLSHPAVKRKLQERYGRRLPLRERVISPQAMFASPKLVTVWSSGQR